MSIISAYIHLRRSKSIRVDFLVLNYIKKIAKIITIKKWYKSYDQLLGKIRGKKKNIYLLFVFLVFTVFEVSLISRLIQIFSDVEIRFNLLQHKKQSFSQSISLTLVERVD